MPLYGLLEGYFRLRIDSRALLTSCFSAMGYYKIQSGSRTPHYVKFLLKLEMSIPQPVDFISTPVPSQGGISPDHLQLITGHLTKSHIFILSLK